ncbi:MAG: glycogen debranching N-terminal domain-containing protein, partial [Candidatus Gastranaerophilales bacterium]|nr:glycogen debranching N-terminal domain-containing protein [Candidatus Gastranaerophilales bacterium]
MTVTIMGKNYSPIRRTIKHNNMFMVTDENGNITGDNTSGYGLYSDDTRFLKRFELKINETDPIILSSSTETGYSSIIIGTNVSMPNTLELGKIIEQETVQIKRESIILGSYFETVTIANYNFDTIGVEICLTFEADFLDIFEVRKLDAIAKEKNIEPVYDEKSLRFVYVDITGATLSTEILFKENIPIKYENGNLYFRLILEPSEKKELKLQINLKTTASLPEKLTAYDFNDAFEKMFELNAEDSSRMAKYYSNNEDFNELLQRGVKDVKMLTTRACYGEYIAAGIPWFTTLFGRDSLIAARQALMFNPDLAKNILLTLARFQSKGDNEWRDEEFGKIPHEIRFGELARSNQIPHSPYYGSIDATCLWLILYYDYFKWTNDRETIENLWQNALDCLYWLDNHGITNKYVYYIKRSKKGLDNQGWKDSHNSNIHSNGILADPPIALVEVQGYAYSSKTKLAEMAGYLGEYALKINLIQDAYKFKTNFNKDFWMKDLGFFTQGLDKNGE